MNLNQSELLKLTFFHYFKRETILYFLFQNIIMYSVSSSTRKGTISKGTIHNQLQLIFPSSEPPRPLHMGSFLQSSFSQVFLVHQLIFWQFFINYSTVDLFCFYEFPDEFFLTIRLNQLYWHFLYCFDLNKKDLVRFFFNS